MSSEGFPQGYPARITDDQPTPFIERRAAEAPLPDGGCQLADAFDLDEMLAEIPGGFEMAVDLASLFLTECPAMLRQIREGLHDDNPRLVRRGAHTLKSSAGIFCADAMVDAAWRLERLACEGDSAALKGPYADLERESARVMEGLKRLCAGG
ncbi:MAG: Hpt domain-containing protein [Planctomycetaceae bacterium]